MKALALVDCNNFYVSCERLFRPDLKNVPVVVLSNNDGCVVSRSQEVKDLKIEMGAPLFMIRDLVKKHRIRYFSSNYTLYNDLSHRVMGTIEMLSNDVDVYSIDEAFATVEQNAYSKSFTETGIEMRKTIKRNVGIPTSIGIAPTKLLAKLAGKLAKKTTDGVFDLTDTQMQDEVLGNIDVLELWGIGSKLGERLAAINVRTARDFRDLDIRTARKVLTVEGARLVEELRGNQCKELELFSPLKKNITRSRSFSGRVTEFRELMESVVVRLSEAAEQIRKHNLVASAISVFIQTDSFQKGAKQYANSGTIKMQKTDLTSELIPYAKRILQALYRPGFEYKKSGVNLLGLQPKSGSTQRLFGEKEYLEDRGVMEAIDRINAKYGRSTIRFGWKQENHNNWIMARKHLSPAYTTDINQILKVKD